jgi:hypothetical protein
VAIQRGTRHRLTQEPSAKYPFRTNTFSISDIKQTSQMLYKTFQKL